MPTTDPMHSAPVFIHKTCLPLAREAVLEGRVSAVRTCPHPELSRAFLHCFWRLTGILAQGTSYFLPTSLSVVKTGGLSSIRREILDPENQGSRAHSADPAPQPVSSSLLGEASPDQVSRGVGGRTGSLLHPVSQKITNS